MNTPSQAIEVLRDLIESLDDTACTNSPISAAQFKYSVARARVLVRDADRRDANAKLRAEAIKAPLGTKANDQYVASQVAGNRWLADQYPGTDQPLPPKPF